jgi:hypothetical protein
MRLCRNSVHGSTIRQVHGLPRTEYRILKINKLAVRPACGPNRPSAGRPEPVEGRMANYDTVYIKGRLGGVTNTKAVRTKLNYYRLKAVGCIPAASRLKVLSNAKC